MIRLIDATQHLDSNAQTKKLEELFDKVVSNFDDSEAVKNLFINLAFIKLLVPFVETDQDLQNKTDETKKSLSMFILRDDEKNNYCYTFTNFQTVEDILNQYSTEIGRDIYVREYSLGDLINFLKDHLKFNGTVVFAFSKDKFLPIPFDALEQIA